MNEKFSQRDVEVFTHREMTRDEVEVQVEKLLIGGRKIDAIRPCKHGDGISQINEVELVNLMHLFQESLNKAPSIKQFVPSSGAASRMFKALLTGLTSDEELVLLDGWKRFPFSQEMIQRMSRTNSVLDEIIRVIIDPDSGLGLAAKPKGCVPFHLYEDGEVRTAFEEHLFEWEACCGGRGGLVFTIQNQFRSEVEALLHRAKVPIELEEQHVSTDTVAWNLDTGGLLREANGDLVWRPGGHGALLKNLGEVDGDLVFVRNIDNVVDEWGMDLRRRWQQALGGLALSMQQERDGVAVALRRGDHGAVEAARSFLQGLVEFAQEPDSLDAWIQAVDRPIRVAGMVPNAGQPGGGPFWIADDVGNLRPGIAEKAELGDGMMESGTHFNPVELACVLVDASGKRFDLRDFADHSAFFTAQKTHGATPIRILERPGLWNGGMADWLTQFVEVPAEIFAPVKTVFDLLERRPRRRS